jgi:4'-phosphopantetheinyl transferase
MNAVFDSCSRSVSRMNVYWLEQSGKDVPAENDWLGASEMLCLDAMRFAKRRADWRLGRWTAKCALSAYLSVPATLESFREMEILAAPDGTPEAFVSEARAPVTISLSHRSAVAICAVANSDVYMGCDLEIVEAHSQAFVADYFTVAEQARVRRASAEDRNRLVTLLWSAKESALKALRTGLRLDTRSVIVNPFLATFDRNGWSPLSVRYAAGHLPEDGSNIGRYLGDRVLHGWWQNSDKAVRTVVAAPPTDSPIPLKSTDHALERPYKFAAKFA